MIALSDIHKSYTTGASQLHVLKGINLAIDNGERNMGQVLKLISNLHHRQFEDFFNNFH